MKQYRIKGVHYGDDTAKYYPQYSWNWWPFWHTFSFINDRDRKISYESRDSANGYIRHRRGLDQANTVVAVSKTKAPY